MLVLGAGDVSAYDASDFPCRKSWVFAFYYQPAAPPAIDGVNRKGFENIVFCIFFVPNKKSEKSCWAICARDVRIPVVLVIVFWRFDDKNFQFVVHMR